MSNVITLPGLIDCHVHFREPGLTHKADMASESAAAAAGGVTTVCEMPNTIPPVVTVEALADKVRRAEKIRNLKFGIRNFDMRFFMGATEKKHLLALRDIWRGSSPALQQLKKRCCGLKVFFDHSTGNQGADQETITEAFRVCGEMGIPLVAHCEDARINSECGIRNSELRDISTHSKNRPPESEMAAIKRAIGLAREYGTQFHVAHLSTAGGLQLVREAKKEGLPVTCEVTPHHLFLTVDDYKTLGTLGKMNPPLRSKEDQTALWAGIADGTVDCVSTDHAPHTLEEKISGDPLKAPSGVPGVETVLPLLLTVAAGKWPHPERTFAIGHWRFAISDIVRLCFENPNRIFQLGRTKTDRMITVDLDQEWVICGKDLHSKCGWTPYEGWRVKGAIVTNT